MTQEQQYHLVKLYFTLYVLKLVDREHMVTTVNDKVAAYFSYLDTFA